MKITLSGYGKMGREIEKTALKNNHSITAKLDTRDDWIAYRDKINKSDVIIDFTQPDTVMFNIDQAFQLNLPMVVGTTGWDDKKEEVRRICLKKNQSLFVASNFSIGVNIFFEINTLLAMFMDKYTEYEIGIEEIHHKQKLDKPSGTALELAKQIIGQVNRKNKWILENNSETNELTILSKRIENITGTHKVTYLSKVDQIEIKHTALNREGFAKGALLAAEWIIGKKGYFGMKDLLGIG